VGEVFPKLSGVVEAEEISVGLLLLLQDALILLFLGVRLETLPGEGTTEEVHQYEPQALHVVSATLFDAEMGVDGRIAGGTSQIFTLNVRDVATSTGVLIFLCQTKIDDMNHVLRGESDVRRSKDATHLSGASSNQEVVWLDIAMDI
jgi:hypothetical protein